MTFTAAEFELFCQVENQQTAEFLGEPHRDLIDERLAIACAMTIAKMSNIDKVKARYDLGYMRSVGEHVMGPRFCDPVLTEYYRSLAVPCLWLLIQGRKLLTREQAFECLLKKKRVGLAHGVGEYLLSSDGQSLIYAGPAGPAHPAIAAIDTNAVAQLFKHPHGYYIVDDLVDENNNMVVYYDPVSGTTWPEAMVAKSIDKLIDGGQRFAVGGGNEIAYLRWLVKQKRLQNLSFHYGKEIIEVDANGNLKSSPKGFGDFLETYLMDLL